MSWENRISANGAIIETETRESIDSIQKRFNVFNPGEVSNKNPNDSHIDEVARNRKTDNSLCQESCEGRKPPKSNFGAPFRPHENKRAVFGRV